MSEQCINGYGGCQQKLLHFHVEGKGLFAWDATDCPPPEFTVWGAFAGLRRERDEAVRRAEEAEWRAERLTAFVRYFVTMPCEHAARNQIHETCPVALEGAEGIWCDACRARAIFTMPEKP